MVWKLMHWWCIETPQLQKVYEIGIVLSYTISSRKVIYSVFSYICTYTVTFSHADLEF